MQNRQQLRPFLGTPKAIKKLLDRYVIGQDAAKEALSSAIFLHEAKISAKLKGLRPQIQPNVLLVGPSGTGKTLLVETLARETMHDLISVDCQSLTTPGFKGIEISDAILSQCHELNLTSGSNAILFLDEIDKIGVNLGGTLGDSNKTVQASLLRIIEGKPFQGQRGASQHTQTFDTSNFFIVATGAFTNVVRDKKELRANLQAYGMTPELISRFPLIEQTEQLDKDSLEAAIRERLFEFFEPYHELYAVMGQMFSPTDLEIETIMARVKSGGLRQVHSVIMEVFLPRIMEFKYQNYIAPDELDEEDLWQPEN